MTQTLAVLTMMLTVATPLVFAGLGEVITERSGVLNLGIEGTMYLGAFVGFLASGALHSAWWGILVAMLAGAAAGALMGLLTVTVGVNQHVAGIGTTLLLVAACNFVSRLKSSGGASEQVPKLSKLFGSTAVIGQYPLTYLALFVVAPVIWWVLRSTGMGLKLRAVGESPEAADAAGVSVPLTRYLALTVGGAFMGLGGAFLTVAMLGSFSLDIVSGRGWVCIALVIFGRWKVWPTVGGALLFGFAEGLEKQLAITTTFASVPNELWLALPYIVVVAALIIWGRGVRYPGAYLKAYKRA
ncbi:MAG: ABC transporter permease [Bifidobacteriaceae bacterium]|jgi:simple sugar transport system permease protein|nr:ABC transporter permease [Bifidobacteriaceae bacterium]